MFRMKPVLISFLFLMLFPVGSDAKEKTIILNKGALIEATYMKVENNETLGKYYKELIPLAKAYGAKPLIDFSVVSVDQGKLRPNFIVLFEFPGSKEFEEFQQDSRFRKIRPILVRATSGLYIEHSRVDNDTTFTFSDEKIYELYSLWINSKNAHHLDTYFNLVGAETSKWGAKFPISLKPVCISSKNRIPSTFGITEWPNKESKEHFLNSKAFTRNVHHRSKALDKMHLFNAKAVIY